MNQGTRKLMMMHMALLPRNDIDYVCQEKMGWEGLANIDDCVDSSIKELANYIKKNK